MEQTRTFLHTNTKTGEPELDLDKVSPFLIGYLPEYSIANCVSTLHGLGWLKKRILEKGAYNEAFEKKLFVDFEDDLYEHAGRCYQVLGAEALKRCRIIAEEYLQSIGNISINEVTFSNPHA